MRSDLKKLLHTTAVRLSLKYSLIYIAIFGVILLMLYWFISNFVQDQIKASLRQEALKIEYIYSKQGIKAVKNYITNHEKYKGEDHRYYLLVDKGKLIVGDLKKWPEKLQPNENIRNLWVSKKEIIGRVPDGDGYWPMLAVKLKDGYKLLIAQGIKGTEDLRETMFTIMAIIFGTLVILMLWLGISLGKKVVWHINSINTACQNIMKGNIKSRIEITGRNDEFDLIALRLNEMLDKIETLISESQQTINNVAHDLRIPLNRIRNRIEIGLLENNLPDYKSILKETIDDIDSLIKTFNNILKIAQAESEAARKDFKRINLEEIVEDIIDLYSPLIDEKRLTLEKNIEPANITGDKYLISQAISNILDNAVKYSTKNGKISVHLKKENNKAVLAICDNGPGVKEKDYEKITKRFVRLDNSRHTKGNGLGLSLVKAVVDLHKAKLTFEDNKPGLCVKVLFND